MAERGLTAGVLAAIAARTIRPVLFFEGEYVSGGAAAYLRLFTGIGTLSWDGKTWTGGRDLLSITPIKESRDLVAIGFAVRMSGLPAAKLSIALQSMRKNKPGKLWLGFFEPDYIDFDFTEATLQAKVGAGTAAITFTRAGATATRVNSSGLIETVAADTPRIDYDPVTLACKGLLIEEARTQAIPYSVFQGSTGNGVFPTGWGGAGLSALAMTTVAGPVLGFTTNYVQIRRNNVGFQGIQSAGNLGFTTAVAYRPSCYVRVPTGVTAEAVLAYFPGATPSTVQLASAAALNAQPKDVWVRYDAAITFSVVGGSTPMGVVSSGSVNGQGCDIALPQFETGAVATSWIPSTGAAVTRNADVATISDISGFFNASEGTIAVEAIAAPSNPTAQILFSFNNGTATTQITAHRQSGIANFDVSVGGVAQAAIAGGAVANSTLYRHAVAYKANDFASAVDGTLVGSDTSGSLPTVDRLHLGHRVNLIPFNGHLRRFRYYPRRLPDSDLQVLSGSAPVEIAWGSQRLIPDPYALRRGRFNVAPISRDGETMTIEARYEDRLILLELPGGPNGERRYTHEDQQLRLAGDKGFDQVPELQDAQDVWGGESPGGTPPAAPPGGGSGDSVGGGYESAI